MGKLGDMFKGSQKGNIGNPLAMRWGWGNYDANRPSPYAALNKQSRQKMTAKQKSDYLAREESKGEGYIRTPLTSRYS